MTSNADITRQFTDATNAHDRAALEALVTEDCHFSSARLPIVADGRADVASAMINWLDLYTDHKIVILREFYVGDEGFNEWRFTAKLDGEDMETHGVDYYRFKDGMIAEKNSFRKFLF